MTVVTKLTDKQRRFLRDVVAGRVADIPRSASIPALFVAGCVEWREYRSGRWHLEATDLGRAALQKEQP